ncbi:MAG: hypothetical protein HRT90_11175 [Candidatus Margulisbacteria bacterium]|nr:hypothetical protein [Candidatus Margulisiibacteriota bacterium]
MPTVHKVAAPVEGKEHSGSMLFYSINQSLIGNFDPLKDILKNATLSTIKEQIELIEESNDDLKIEHFQALERVARLYCPVSVNHYIIAKLKVAKAKSKPQAPHVPVVGPSSSDAAASAPSSAESPPRSPVSLSPRAIRPRSTVVNRPKPAPQKVVFKDFGNGKIEYTQEQEDGITFSYTYHNGNKFYEYHQNGKLVGVTYTVGTGSKKYMKYHDQEGEQLDNCEFEVDDRGNISIMSGMSGHDEDSVAKIEVLCKSALSLGTKAKKMFKDHKDQENAQVQQSRGVAPEKVQHVPVAADPREPDTRQRFADELKGHREDPKELRSYEGAVGTTVHEMDDGSLRYNSENLEAVKKDNIVTYNGVYEGKKYTVEGIIEITLLGKLCTVSRMGKPAYEVLFDENEHLRYQIPGSEKWSVAKNKTEFEDFDFYVAALDKHVKASALVDRNDRYLNRKSAEESPSPRRVVAAGSPSKVDEIQSIDAAPGLQQSNPPEQKQGRTFENKIREAASKNCKLAFATGPGNKHKQLKKMEESVQDNEFLTGETMDMFGSLLNLQQLESGSIEVVCLNYELINAVYTNTTSDPRNAQHMNTVTFTKQFQIYINAGLKIRIPIANNIPGKTNSNHWNFLEYDPNKNQIVLIDSQKSLKENIQVKVQIFREFLENMTDSKISLIKIPTDEQQDGNSCGPMAFLESSDPGKIVTQDQGIQRRRTFQRFFQDAKLLFKKDLSKKNLSDELLKLFKKHLDIEQVILNLSPSLTNSTGNPSLKRNVGFEQGETTQARRNIEKLTKAKISIFEKQGSTGVSDKEKRARVLATRARRAAEAAAPHKTEHASDDSKGDGRLLETSPIDGFKCTYEAVNSVPNTNLGFGTKDGKQYVILFDDGSKVGHIHIEYLESGEPSLDFTDSKTPKNSSIRPGGDLSERYLQEALGLKKRLAKIRQRAVRKGRRKASENTEGVRGHRTGEVSGDRDSDAKTVKTKLQGFDYCLCKKHNGKPEGTAYARKGGKDYFIVFREGVKLASVEIIIGENSVVKMGDINIASGASISFSDTKNKAYANAALLMRALYESSNPPQLQSSRRIPSSSGRSKPKPPNSPTAPKSARQKKPKKKTRSWLDKALRR